MSASRPWQTSGVGVAGSFDLIISNPPYLVDPLARVYRHGGGELGSALSVEIAVQGVDRLAPGGRLLLYTGSGVPLDAGGASIDPQRRVLRTKSGKQIFNAYPIRYFDPGTGEVAHPGAAPHVTIPRIATPPLPVAK